MKDFSAIRSRIPVLFIVGGLILTLGCDMGTYGRRMKDKAKPMQTDTDQVPANGGNADNEEDNTEE